MHAFKIVVSTQEFNDFVKKRLNEQDAKKYENCEWVPAVVKTTELLQIEMIVIPAK